MSLDEDDDWEDHGLWRFFYRLGFFQRKEVPISINACKAHQDALTWKFQKDYFHKYNCMMPDAHTGRAGSKCKSSAGRPVTVQQSFDYLYYLGKLVPMDAFLCNNCRTKADKDVDLQKQHQVEQAERMDIDDHIAEQGDDEQKDKSFTPNEEDQSLSLLNQLLKLHGQKVNVKVLFSKEKTLKNNHF